MSPAAAALLERAQRAKRTVGWLWVESDEDWAAARELMRAGLCWVKTWPQGWGMPGDGLTAVSPYVGGVHGA